MRFPCSKCGSRDWPSKDTSCPLCREDEPSVHPVINIISDVLEIDPLDLRETFRLDMMGLDSLDMVDIVLAIENHYEIEIESTQQWSTIGDVISAVSKAQKQQEASPS